MTFPTSLLMFAAAVGLIDAGLRGWRPARAAIPANVLTLAAAWIPFFALPHVGSRTVTGLAGLLGLLAMLDFSRAAGLSRHGRFFLPAFILTAVSYPVAAFQHGALLPAVPALALLGLATTSALSRIPQAFLQKLALSWLAVLVYGYLHAHTVLFAHAAWPTHSGTMMLAVVILLANCAHVALRAVGRLTTSPRLPLLVTPLAGFAAGKIVQILWPAIGGWRLAVVGLAIGGALSVGLRAHGLVVAEVKADQERRRNGTLVFEFALAVAVGYWLLVFQVPPAWTA